MTALSATQFRLGTNIMPGVKGAEVVVNFDGAESFEYTDLRDLLPKSEPRFEGAPVDTLKIELGGVTCLLHAAG